MPFGDLFWYRAALVRVVDGDTVVFEIDKGMRDRSEESIRVAGVNAAELFSGSDRVAGAGARDFTAAWLGVRAVGRWPFLLHTFKDAKSFDRWVADVFDAVSGDSLADAIRGAGWDRPPG